MCTYTRKLPGIWISSETKERIRGAVADAGGYNPPRFHRSWMPAGVSVTITAINCDCAGKIYPDEWAKLFFGDVLT
jgi:hypothetical protein